LSDIAPYGHADFEPKLIGKGINVMISPLPRNKRGKNPGLGEGGSPTPLSPPKPTNPASSAPPPKSKAPGSVAPKPPPAAFANNPFAKLDVQAHEDATSESLG